MWALIALCKSFDSLMVFPSPGYGRNRAQCWTLGSLSLRLEAMLYTHGPEMALEHSPCESRQGHRCKP
jgi:hypothetical protein